MKITLLPAFGFTLALSTLCFFFFTSHTYAQALTACDADINRDGTVNIADYTIMVNNFFKVAPDANDPTVERSDLNKNNRVDVTDYSLFLPFFFQSCTSSSPSPSSALYTLKRIDPASDIPYPTNSIILNNSTIPDQPFSIEAEVPNTDVKSVRFTLSGPNTNHTATENGKPFALFGDTDGDFVGRDLNPGQYTLKVQLYAQQNALGTLIHSSDVRFTIDSGSTLSPTAIPVSPTVTPGISSGFPNISGGYNKNMYLSGYSGRTRSPSAPISGSIISVPVGTSVTRLKQIIDTAASGSIIELADGVHTFDRKLLISRGDITLRGKGISRTTIRAAFSSTSLIDNLIEVRAQGYSENAADWPYSNFQATVTSGLSKSSTQIDVTNGSAFSVGDTIMLYGLQNYSLKRYHTVNGKSYGFIGVITRVKQITGNRLTLDHPIGFDSTMLASDLKEVRVSKINMLKNLTLSDFKVEYNLGTPGDTSMNNNKPEYAVWGKNAALKIVGTDQINLRNIEVRNMGSMAFELRSNLELYADNLQAHFSWNRGGGGNGYAFTYGRLFYSELNNLVDTGMRHGVVTRDHEMSAFNRFHVKSSTSNIDFHGGADHSNFIHVEKLTHNPNRQYNFTNADFREKTTEYRNTVTFDLVTNDGSNNDVIRAGNAGAQINPDFPLASNGTNRPDQVGERIFSGIGNDSITLKGTRTNRIYLNPNSGNDIVYGFNSSHQLVIPTGLNSIRSFTNLKSKMSGTTNTIIDLGSGNSITLMNFTPSAFKQNNLCLVTPDQATGYIEFNNCQTVLGESDDQTNVPWYTLLLSWMRDLFSV